MPVLSLIVKEIIYLALLFLALLFFNESPYRGRIVPELKRIKVMDYREIIVNPYRIIYRFEDNTVIIFAVFDGRRQIDDIIYQRVTGL